MQGPFWHADRYCQSLGAKWHGRSAWICLSGWFSKVEKETHPQKTRLHSLNCSLFCSKERRRNWIFGMSTVFFFEFLGASKNPGKKVFQWLQLPVLFEKMMENRTAFTLKAQHPKHMAEHVLSLFYFKDIKGDKPYTPKLQPWKVTGTQKERILFQPSFFRGYVRLCGVSRGLLPGEMVLGRS